MPAACLTTTPADPALVRRVNQLYHDLTQEVFDAEHRYRHRVEQGFWRRVAEQLVEPSSSNQTVVDLACGTGFVTRWLGRALGTGDRLIAIDVSTRALHTTGRNFSADHKRPSGSPRLVRLAGDGQQLPLPSGCVDLLAMNAGLHHVPDPAAALREIDRVLKPGGLFALGFEPNLRHFASFMGRLSRGFDRLAWYASPRQNLRRVCEHLGAGATADAPAGAHREAQATARRLNHSLMQIKAVDQPLTADAMLDLVDPHARGARSAAGFDSPALLAECFPGYRIIRLVTSDYLGETPRRSRLARGCIDAAFRLIWPAHGSLVSWVIRKPTATARHEPPECARSTAEFAESDAGGNPE